MSFSHFALGTVCLLVLTAVRGAKDHHSIHQDLYDYVIGKCHHDVIPQTSLDTPVGLKLDLIVLGLRQREHGAHVITADVWISMSWDTDIRFLPEQFNNLAKINVPVSKIWVPDIALYDGEMETVGSDRIQQAVIDSEGKVLYVPMVKMHTNHCVPSGAGSNATTCYFKLGSWTRSSRSLFLNNVTSVDLTNLVKGPHIGEIAASAEKKSATYPCCPEPYESVEVQLTFTKND